MKVLNLGCGTKTSSSKEVINIDWSIYLRIKKSPILTAISRFFLNGERLNKLNSLPNNIEVHDLSRGVPFPSDSVDAVYHSHFLEHLDRVGAKNLLVEIKRVLKPNGIHRVVIPDFENLCRQYTRHVEICENNPNESSSHDKYLSDIIEQMIKKEAYGTSQQPPFRRFVENLILGDARRRGQIHKLMYDRINLSWLLKEVGYRKITIQRYNTSNIKNWDKYALDIDEFGNEYKPGSLYVEAFK